jgi:hypothetical protein
VIQLSQLKKVLGSEEDADAGQSPKNNSIAMPYKSKEENKDKNDNSLLKNNAKSSDIIKIQSVDGCVKE